jgi:ribonuclease HIII
MDNNSIDLVKYGVLWERVENYEKKFDSMERKIDNMDADIKKLVGMAERGRGGFWVGMTIVAALSTVFGWAIHWFGDK